MFPFKVLLTAHFGGRKSPESPCLMELNFLIILICHNIVTIKTFRLDLLHPSPKAKAHHPAKPTADTRWH